MWGWVSSCWLPSILKVPSYKVERKSEQEQAPHYFHCFSKQRPPTSGSFSADSEFLLKPVETKSLGVGLRNPFPAPPCFLPVFIFREGCEPLQCPGLVPGVSAVPSLGRKLPGRGTQQAHSFPLTNPIMPEFSRSLPPVDQGCLDLSSIYLYALSRLVLSSGWHYFFLLFK